MTQVKREGSASAGPSLEENMSTQQSVEEYVADAVARVYASCGHGPLIFGCVAGGKPFVWCRHPGCGRSYFTVEALKQWAKENAQKERR
jgi:hypothetical protein